LNKNIHIVSFDVPYPPNYGGVIDVFYKIAALHKLGYKIHLHTYEYGRGKQKILENYCEEITYYKRSKSPLNLLSSKPFIVKSRSDSRLIKNLKKDTFPILFEGLHTTFPLNDFEFNDRKIIIRTHNIEHKYYNGLAKSEQKLARKSFFKQEAKKLKSYEKILQKADYILTISPYEQAYFQKKYGKKAQYIPVFHKNNAIHSLSEKGTIALYHGDLRVSDNVKASRFLVNVFKELSHPLVIASSYIHKEFENTLKKYSNISFVKLIEVDDLDRLFQEAHVNVLPTFQKTGIKLKLIHALFESRFCVVNNAMIEDTGLENICKIADNVKEFREQINQAFNQKYTMEEQRKKEATLSVFNNQNNAVKIAKLMA